MSEIPEPTADDCTQMADLPLPDGRTATALWWPQMGGYVGRCLAALDDDGCIDLWVWHDGEFPFPGLHDRLWGRQPVELHVDDPEDFVRFGNQLNTIVKGE